MDHLLPQTQDSSKIGRAEQQKRLKKLHNFSQLAQPIGCNRMEACTIVSKTQRCNEFALSQLCILINMV